MKKETKNKAASVRAKLLNVARAEGIDFDALLLRYFQERFLYRLTVSKFSNYLILKGALLLLCLDVSRSRPTKDIDFLAVGIKNDLTELEDVFRSVAQLPCNDGVNFDPSSVVSERIKEEADYEGIRLKINTTLSQAKKRLQLDVGFGDIIRPGAILMELPTILEEDRPKIRVYSIESVISEKFEAMVKLAMVNSRMKDFYDVYTLSTSHDFESNRLKEAVEATFKRRKISIPDEPLVFRSEFYQDKGRQQQWTAFLRKVRLDDVPRDFSEIMKKITLFLKPIVVSVKGKTDVRKHWDAETGYWKE